ncbi:MAG: MBL fold metallo-hydrolase [Candidatus Aminicenantes bacterium]|nr:MBL fold metallo-hydrolase [Candidatus Aminicenantes bacterium]
MIVHHFFIKGIAHSSYLIGGQNKCAIVDPRRDVQVYIDAARDMDLEITHILETHLHADFISGHLDLARKTGARIFAPKSARCRFEHVPLAEGDTFRLEDMKFSVLETPGHTPEHISYGVTDTARGKDPVAVFCGDTLFVGDVGRPDLFPGMAEKLASKLYDSLFAKLLKLPDFCEVYPAHGAGSLCGRAMAAKRTSTIGYEKKYNDALQIKDRVKFIRSLTSDMPPAPDHFSRCSEINRRGPNIVEDLPPMEGWKPRVFARKIKGKNVIILDVRSYSAFGGQHLGGSTAIDSGGNFATFAGWVLPPQADIALVAEDRKQAEEAVVWLRRVGLDRVKGFMEGSLFAWSREGLPVEHVPQLSAQELHGMIKKGEKMTIVDVRSPNEFAGTYIEGAVNIPAPDLRTKYKTLKKDIPVILICSTGHRSSLGASLLKQHGFWDVRNVAGGMTGYSAAGFSKECRLCFNPHGPHFMGQWSSLKMMQKMAEPFKA